MHRSSIDLLRKKTKDKELGVLPSPSFSGTYSDDYDIIVVDTKIRKYLNSLKFEEEPLSKDILKLKKKLKSTATSNDAAIIKQEISVKKERLSNIKDLTFLRDYEVRTSEIIRLYKLDSVDSKSYNDSKYLVEEFIREASDFCHIDVTKVGDSNFIPCVSCYGDLSGVLPGPDGFTECPNCECVEEYCFVSKVIEDNRYVEAQKTHQPHDETIRKMIANYQGKDTDFDNSLIPEIDKYFRKNKLYEYLREGKGEMIAGGKIKGTSIPKMLKILNDMGYKKESKHVYYICHMCWGWKLNDLTHLEEKIVDIYGMLRAEFTTKFKGKKAPNGHWFYKILLELGIDCEYEDFNLPKSPDCISSLEGMWKEISKAVDFT